MKIQSGICGELNERQRSNRRELNINNQLKSTV